MTGLITSRVGPDASSHLLGIVCPCRLCGLQVFTNDAFFASNHRVLKSTAMERYSRAYFFNPSFKADITPSRDLTIASEYCGFVLLLCVEMRQVS